jgi:oxysterol-binding protein 1
MLDVQQDREKLLEELVKNNQGLLDIPNQSEEDPPEREQLPYLKDPKIKISLWSILKDSLGKDLSKITVPVYFNQPLNIL